MLIYPSVRSTPFFTPSISFMFNVKVEIMPVKFLLGNGQFFFFQKQLTYKYGNHFMYFLYVSTSQWKPKPKNKNKAFSELFRFRWRGIVQKWRFLIFAFLDYPNVIVKSLLKKIFSPPSFFEMKSVGSQDNPIIGNSVAFSLSFWPKMEPFLIATAQRQIGLFFKNTGWWSYRDQSTLHLLALSHHLENFLEKASTHIGNNNMNPATQLKD